MTVFVKYLGSCGNGICEGAFNENLHNCPSDCPQLPSTRYTATSGLTSNCPRNPNGNWLYGYKFGQGVEMIGGSICSSDGTTFQITDNTPGLPIIFFNGGNTSLGLFFSQKLITN